MSDNWKNLYVSTDGVKGPYLMCPNDCLNEVTSLLEKENVPFIQAPKSSDSFAIIEFGKGCDQPEVDHINKLLEGLGMKSVYVEKKGGFFFVHSFWMQPDGTITEDEAGKIPTDKVKAFLKEGYDIEDDIPRPLKTKAKKFDIHIFDESSMDGLGPSMA